ncbi:DUF4328 domain-containing protein [Mycobacterium kyorinense]|uniref:DUF4328 domain-containing protein n=1 Tax=Mycobacterium kyorinense TaxID=487514 RepID=A0A1X1XS66_9MYCO|nr:DUF4328 domain-containing protein [Mycobacterium kyorinense]ORW01686.1 hypothetical protein AWC14_07650 [Mycobacterium kyorinense]
MIQACSQCGTRWNVRDRQRVWCPRCRGTLLPPSPEGQAVDPRWSARSAAPTAGRRMPPRLPPGYRWIAVRPGAPPPPRRRRRPLGPTPRYAVIPRWGLVDRVEPGAATPAAAVPPGPSAARVRTTLFATLVVLGIAALVHFVRYLLLIINRGTLLNPWVAGAALWLGVLASAAAIAMVITCAVVLIRWLIARRAAAFAHYGLPEPRSARALWAGCFIPLVNLLWAPVYVIELAATEDVLPRLRKPILLWWIVWVISTAVSIFAIATSRAQDAQGIADNTVTTIFAYLVAAAAVAAAGRVFEGFERKPVERPAHRWVVVADDRGDAPGSAPAVESEGEEPAA